MQKREHAAFGAAHAEAFLEAARRGMSRSRAMHIEVGIQQRQLSLAKERCKNN